MNCNVLTRWLWVVVATLAVAPLLAQTPQPAWRPTIPGPAAALSQYAQASGPASSAQISGNTQASADPIPPEASLPFAEPGPAAGRSNVEEKTKATPRKAAANSLQ